MTRLRVCMLSRFSRSQLCETLWTVAHQSPLSMGFSKQEYWSGFPCPPPGDLLKPGIEPMCLTSPALAGRIFTTSTTWETQTLSETVDQMGLIDIFRTFHPDAEEYTFFSSAHETFSRIDHILGHKSKSVNFKKLKLYQASFLTTMP